MGRRTLVRIERHIKEGPISYEWYVEQAEAFLRRRAAQAALRDGLANKVALAAEASNQDLSQQIAAMIDARLAADPNKNGASEQARKAEADARRAAINACKDADGKFFKWCPYMKLCVCQKLGLSDGKHHFERAASARSISQTATLPRSLRPSS